MNRHASPHRRSFAWPLALLIGLAVGCGDDDDPSDDQKPSSGVRIHFEERSEQAGIILKNRTGDRDKKKYALESIGPGAAFFDADGDSDLDVFVVNGTELQGSKAVMESKGAFYRNEGGLRFVDQTEESGLIFQGMGQTALAADFDNDGDQDLYVTAWGKNALFENDGTGKFQNVALGTDLELDGYWSVPANAIDYDLDGDLDLYVGNYFAMGPADPDAWAKTDCEYNNLRVNCGPKGMIAEPDFLFRNEGDLKFVDVSEESGIREVRPAYALSSITTDLDQDGLPDIYVANDSLANCYFHNLGGGRFEEIGLETCSAFSDDGRGQAGMGIAVGDCDGDGWEEIYVTNFSHDYNTLYKNIGEGMFMDDSFVAGFGQDAYFLLGWGTALFDIENDGDLDIYVANGHVYPQIDERRPETSFAQKNLMYLNDGFGKFDQLPFDSFEALQEEMVSRGAAFGDLDNDGDVDILVINLNDRPSLLVNECENKGNSWLVQVVGQSSNRDGVGTRLWVRDAGEERIFEVRSGGSFTSSNDPRVHVGLGASKTGTLRVRFPSGAEQTFEDVAANQILIVTEGSDTLETRPFSN